MCAVCLEELSSEHTHALDGCGHTFHSGCLISWFQRGRISCPTCRSDAHQSESAISPMALHARASYLRNTVGRRASAPAELKDMISKLRRAESKQREKNKDLQEFKRDHREVVRRMNTLRAQKYSAWRRVRRLERLLGLYQCTDLTLPALVVHS